MSNEPPERDFEYRIKQSSEQLNEQFETVLSALDRLAARDAAEADPEDFETIRRAATEIGRVVQLDRRVQHRV